MERMVRKQIYLKTRQEEQLKRLVQETGLSEAELIRQAIDSQSRTAYTLVLDAAAWQAERRFIQELIAQGPVQGRRKWQREDLHER
jgi:hypothetical protein